MQKIRTWMVKTEMAVLNAQKSEAGEAALEYAVLAGIIIVAVLTAFTDLGSAIASVFRRAAAALGG
jgi:Flp pilus assembly pilin Flp